MRGPESNGEKLIRYLIPERALRKGERMETRRVEGEEHVAFLRLKIKEEAVELAAAGSGTFVSELADVRQALIDFCAVAGVRLANVQQRIREAPSEESERIPFFKAEIRRLVELAGALPLDGSEAEPYVEDILSSIKTIASVADIEEKEHDERARKLKEKGGFIPGVVWKIDNARSSPLP